MFTMFTIWAPFTPAWPEIHIWQRWGLRNICSTSAQSGITKKKHLKTNKWPENQPQNQGASFHKLFWTFAGPTQMKGCSFATWTQASDFMDFILGPKRVMSVALWSTHQNPCVLQNRPVSLEITREFSDRKTLGKPTRLFKNHQATTKL